MYPYKILYFHPSNELYGADRSLLRLVRLLDKSVYMPYVVVPNDLNYEGLLVRELQKNAIPFKEAKLGVLRRKYFNIRGISLLFYRSIASAIQLANFARQQKFDLIHSNSTAVITGGLVSRLTGIPHIWHVREIITQPIWLNKIIANELNLFANVVVTVSGPTRDNLVKNQTKLTNKITVIHNGLDSSRFVTVTPENIEVLKNKWKLTPETTVIGMVGRISAWKGQAFLVKAAIPVLRRNPNVRLVLVGGSVPGEARHKNNLTTLISQCGVGKQIIVEDFRFDIPAVLSAFDIFALPSIRPDPFPTVVLEAMAAGKPIVATNHGGVIEQVKDGATGYLVSPDNPVEMTVALEKLTSNVSLQKQMGKTGYDRVHKYFTVEKYVNNIQQLYRNILNNPVTAKEPV